ncbi:HAD-IC family P-type ATPase [Candidatus Woesearchaeota archaeon]|nr:HAD-IC family P-type ATPase [Candidatus Woesearchaeota archaeon]
MAQSDKEWYLYSTNYVFKEFNTTKSGLSESEVNKRITHYGRNEIISDKSSNWIKILIRQFKAFVFWVLGFTAFISLLIGHLIEFIVILLIILFSIILNFIMEFKATKEIESLINLVPNNSKVIRAGKTIEVSSSQLVPGDILVIERGNVVGADARIISCENLMIDESALTGESLSVTKTNEIIEKEVNLAQQSNMIFTGTHVTNGHGLAAVVNTGQTTEFGKISHLIKNIEVQTTPLQKRLDKLSKQVALFAAVLSLISFIVGLYHGVYWGSMLIFSMAIIVSGIPESLPSVVAITLALGVKKMANENAIIKRLPAVETLGTCSVICTDKTGTLTENKMIIENIFTSDSEINVTGEGYTPDGLFLQENEEVNAKNHKTISKVLEIGLLCNNSDIKQEENDWVVDGEPTEGALITLARKAGMIKLDYHSKFKRKKEHAFDSTRKIMSTVHRYKGKDFVYSKGAPEYLLKKAKHYLHEGKILKLTSKIKKRFLKKNEKYASTGCRILGLAFKEHTAESLELKHVESELIFVGLVSIRDPPDRTTIESVKNCKDAGIKVVMITGDNEITAKTIATEIGIFTSKDSILTGQELDELSDEEFEKIIEDVSVYARTTPSQKLRIVETFQKVGHIVAMTGDGVNDAPALKKSDIGVAMGLRGSDVAKASSELILKDDKFSTIVKAVEQGRTIYDNIRKFIYYLLVGSISEVLIILFAVFAGVNLPLTALMILFINLVTSEFPAIGLSVEKPTKHIMHQKPRDPKESILNEFVIMRISATVPILIAGSLALYLWEMFNTGDVSTAQTITFATIIMFELFHTFNAKTWNHTIFSKQFFSNKILFLGVLTSLILTFTVIYFQPLQNIFGTTALNMVDWALILIVSSTVILFVELKKLFLKIELKEREKKEIFPTRG